MTFEELDQNNIPKHVAIIMDGNGRWAKKQGFGSRVKGHEKGVAALRDLTTTAAEAGVKFLTVYAFSTENWKRPKYEVNALMRLLVSTLKKEISTLTKNDIRLNAIGDLNSLPNDVAKKLQNVMDETSGNSRLTLTLALSYGSRDEIRSATTAIAKLVQEGKLKPEEITEDTLSENLYTAEMPDPDLLIRTSGEQRISNYLLWQIAYSELYFTETLWPDFSKEEFFKAIWTYQNRERRYGKTSEQLNKG